ncbi:MAG: MFS transporter [Rhodothermales bacterium]
MDTNARHTLFTALAVSLGGFLFGFDASVISGVIRFIRPEFGLTDIQLGWVVSSPSISAMVSMLAAGPVSDRLGRKHVLLLVAFLYVVSAVMSAMAVSFTMLVAARMLGGVAFGAALVLAPMYIAEIAPSNNRGFLVSVQQLNIVLGFSVAYFSNYLILTGIEGDGVIAGLIHDGNAWRWMLGVEAIPAVAYFFLLFTVPQSPRWLYASGRTSEALAVLTELHGKDAASLEASELERVLQLGEPRRAPFRALLHPSVRYVLGVALLLGVLQQITGVNAIYFYVTIIFEQSGIGANASFAQAVWVGIVNVVFTILAMLLIDRMGRRPLMLAGLAGIAVAMCITAYGFSGATYSLSADDLDAFPVEVQEKLERMEGKVFEGDVAFKQTARAVLGETLYRNHEARLVEQSISMNPYVVLFGVLLFVAAFAASLGPVMWVMLSELFPTRLRAVGLSVTGFLNSFVSWMVQFIFPWELSVLGNTGTFLLYGVFALIGLGILYAVMPETKGKSLEELEAHFSSGARG